MIHNQYKSYTANRKPKWQEPEKMAAFDSGNEIKNRIREAADIVQVIGECVELKKAGVRFTGLCPFHGEKTPSFSVNPQGQFFHCFGCGESGDVFSFMMKYHHLTFPEALKDLARRYQIDLPKRSMSDADRARIRQREQLYQVNHEAAQLYHTFLKESDQAAGARQYLEERGVPREIIDQYQLGYTPPPETGGWKFITSRLQAKKISVLAIEQAGLAVKKDNGGHYDRFRDRVLFPIYDLSGREVAFGGRILGEGKPKYMNSPESMIFAKSRLLFGLFQHREAIRRSRRAIVVEGNFDLLLLAVHGIDNVVAPLGTALTRDHIKSLRGYCDEVVLLFDGDSAGLKAARRSIPFFLTEQVEARVALLPEGHDPDTLVREKGSQGIAELVEAATPLPEFVFSALAEEYSLSLSGKNRILSELIELVKGAADPGQRELMVSHFSGLLGVSPDRFAAGKPPQPVPEEPVQQAAGAAPLTRLPKKEQQLLDFLVLYPEFLNDLLAEGLRELIVEPQLLSIIDHLERLSATGTFIPEELLSVLSDPMDKKYIADLLIRGIGDESGSEPQGQELCNELLPWLKSVARQRNGADLQKQINLAQQAGDEDLLLELLRKKQEVAMKK
jgi:DNA primase